MDKEELKQRCLNVIEEHQDEIIALGKEAYKTPELGFKEFRTGKLMEEAFLSLDWSRRQAYPIQAAVCPPVPRETGPGWR